MTADAEVAGLNFVPYEEGMVGGARVAFVVKPGEDYHWYVYDEVRGVWLNKNGQMYATDRILLDLNQDGQPMYGDVISDYEVAANQLGYTVIIGEFYITEMECVE